MSSTPTYFSHFSCFISTNLPSAKYISLYLEGSNPTGRCEVQDPLSLPPELPNPLLSSHGLGSMLILLLSDVIVGRPSLLINASGGLEICLAVITSATPNV